MGLLVSPVVLGVRRRLPEARVVHAKPTTTLMVQPAPAVVLTEHQSPENLNAHAQLQLTLVQVATSVLLVTMEMGLHAVAVETMAGLPPWVVQSASATRVTLVRHAIRVLWVIR